jgi:hypothetical protein
MRIRNILLTSAAVLLSAASIPASATLSMHTWVSGTGNDANTGARNSPYADFATAVANTAAGGIVSVVDPGDYGPVTILQSITIDGGNMGSIGFTGGEGIYIDPASGGTVVLRGLTVDGEGVGTDAIFFSGVGNLTIDNCKLEGFTQIGVGVGSTGIENVVVKNTTIVGGTLGVRTFQSSGLVPYDSVSLDHVTIQGATSAGVFSRNGSMEISNSVITQNNGAGTVGVQADTSANISVESSMITLNTTAVCVYSSAKIRLENVDIFDNGTGVAACGGQIKTNGSNRDSGNTNGNPGVPSEVTATVVF